MMTPSNGSIFRVTGPPQTPETRSFGVFIDPRLNKRLSKQTRCWWFETSSRSWRHCNVLHYSLLWMGLFLSIKHNCHLYIVEPSPKTYLLWQLWAPHASPVSDRAVTISANPDGKVHGANMGPNWGRQGPGGPHVGPMNFTIWEDLHRATSHTACYLKRWSHMLPTRVVISMVVLP